MNFSCLVHLRVLVVKREAKMEEGGQGSDQVHVPHQLDLLAPQFEDEDSKLTIFKHDFKKIKLQILLVCVWISNLTIWHTFSYYSEISNFVRNSKFLQILRSIWNKLGICIVKPPCLGRGVFDKNTKILG